MRRGGSQSIYEPFKRDDIEFKEYLTVKDRWNNFKLFLWNPDTKEVMGRDGASWAKLSLFYFCFYVTLAFIFAAMLLIFWAIIDKRIPPYSNQSSVMARQAINGRIVGVSPGLGFRPQKYDYSTLLRIKSSERNPNHPENYQQYVDYLDYFLSFYEVKDRRGEQIIDCGPTSDPALLEKQFGANKVCRFEIVEMLGPNNMCIKSRNYEFDKSKPCVLLKLNKIYNWKPEPYGRLDPLPHELRPYEDIVRKYPRNVFVLCDGENQVDKDFVGGIRYFSRTEDGSGESRLGFIPFYYFPFKNQDGYRAPLIFAYFHNITTNVLVNVMCRAYAKNIYVNDLYRMGSVHFEIFIN
jgi:sodium/potassium-transporting ATPase subunit beta